MKSIDEILSNTERVWRIFVLATPCREWKRALRNGYGVVWYDDKVQYVHRIIYAHFVEPLQKGLVLDHLCQNPSCCNPDHLDQVTQQKNLNRGIGFSGNNSRLTHCPSGHEYNEKNTYAHGPDSEWRYCKICNRENAKAYYHRKKKRAGQNPVSS